MILSMRTLATSVIEHDKGESSSLDILEQELQQEARFTIGLLYTYNKKDRRGKVALLWRYIR
jgi:hypothetical protein